MSIYRTPEYLLEKYRDIKACSLWTAETIQAMYRDYYIQGIENHDEILINEGSFLKFIDSLPDNLRLRHSKHDK